MGDGRVRGRRGGAGLARAVRMWRHKSPTQACRLRSASGDARCSLHPAQVSWARPARQPAMAPGRCASGAPRARRKLGQREARTTGTGRPFGVGGSGDGPHRGSAERGRSGEVVPDRSEGGPGRAPALGVLGRRTRSGIPPKCSQESWQGGAAEGSGGRPRIPDAGCCVCKTWGR